MKEWFEQTAEGRLKFWATATMLKPLEQGSIFETFLFTRFVPASNRSVVSIWHHGNRIAFVGDNGYLERWFYV